jgi:hypothetical protein
VRIQKGERDEEEEGATRVSEKVLESDEGWERRKETGGGSRNGLKAAGGSDADAS